MIEKISEMANYNNENAEKFALSAVLQSYPRSKKIMLSLGEEHFYNPFHAKVFRSIKEKGASISSLDIEDVPNAIELLESVPTGSTELYIKHLEHALKVRKTGRILCQIDYTNEDSINEIKEKILEIGTNCSTEKYSMPEIGQSICDRWDKHFSDARAVYHLGIPGLDDTLRIRSGNVVVINARPKSGKTRIMTNIANHLGRRHKILFISAEMHPQDLYIRLASKICEEDLTVIDYSDLFSDKIKAKINKWATFSKEINSRKIDILNGRGIGFGQLVSALYQAAYEKYDIVMIDYLQRIHHSGMDRRLQVEEISRSISNIAVKNDMTFIVASQAGRGANQAGRTQAHHSKESGAIEEDADVILSLTKEETDVPVVAPKVTIDVVQRNGISGIFKIKLNMATGEMEEWIEQDKNVWQNQN